jgi:hypothetical protein
MSTRLALYLENGIQLGASISQEDAAGVLDRFSGSWGNDSRRGMVLINNGNPTMLVNAASIVAVTLTGEDTDG